MYHSEHKCNYMIKYDTKYLRGVQWLTVLTVTSCFVYKVIRDIESIDHLCINPILRIGLIQE